MVCSGVFRPIPRHDERCLVPNAHKAAARCGLLFFEDAPGFFVASGRGPELGPDTHIDPLCGGLQTLCVRHDANPDAHGFAPDQPFRLLLGREASVLQRFPSEDPALSELIESFSEVQMADLAGNMVSTSVTLAIAMAAISAVSWKAVPMDDLPRTTFEDCSSAVDLLRRVMPQVRPLGPDSHPEAKRQRP